MQARKERYRRGAGTARGGGYAAGGGLCRRPAGAAAGAATRRRGRGSARDEQLYIRVLGVARGGTFVYARRRRTVNGCGADLPQFLAPPGGDSIGASPRGRRRWRPCRTARGAVHWERRPFDHQTSCASESGSRVAPRHRAPFRRIARAQAPPPDHDPGAAAPGLRAPSAAMHIPITFCNINRGGSRWEWR